ncbi:mitochondrial phosphate carrier protein [Xylaria acuta]|nr:mitochondrial phosphate carrier protein [Xylaria acuta]
MFITRAISVTNSFFVATLALGFQGFEELKKEHLRVLSAIKGTSERASAGKQSKYQQHIPKLSIAKSLNKPNDVALYSGHTLAGAVCCSFTHATLTPIDIVKTRIQVVPLTYNHGISEDLRQVVAGEGAGALATGLGLTYFKARAINTLEYEMACKNRYAIYLGSSSIAEIAGDIVLCPFEAVRIRPVPQPGFGRGMIRQEGIRGLYSGLGPIMLKQVPYTMATFVVYENAIEQAYKWVDRSTISSATITGINLDSGLIADIAETLVPQPADTMLRKINKGKGETGEGALRRFYAGIHARFVMVGGMTTS